MAETVAYLLASHGDSKWLHTRTGIIAFEECWPYAELLSSEMPTVHVLKAVANATKNKDAAGLGSLGYAHSIGDLSVTSYFDDSFAIRVVAAGLKRPTAFFEWAVKQATTPEQISITRAAEFFFKRATWPWDKGFTIAASFLACSPLPPRPPVFCLTHDKFPYWIAVDKHTPEGKNIIASAAKELAISPLKLSWISFYMESSITNTNTISPWWTAERNWKLAQLETDEIEAAEIWRRASELIEKKTEKYVAIMRLFLSLP
ncbi:hypothetical protein V3H56_22270 [Pseudomonas sp. MS646]|uniref:hypothetical protein n=1 Tax=Pseudomonas sp. MS646 TaxID=3118751 RepID=UPI0030CB5192